ncbi:hypothetical protein RJZ57_006060 [Blastomyces gilchristii]
MIRQASSQTLAFPTLVYRSLGSQGPGSELRRTHSQIRLTEFRNDSHITEVDDIEYPLEIPAAEHDAERIDADISVHLLQSPTTRLPNARPP